MSSVVYNHDDNSSDSGLEDENFVFQSLADYSLWFEFVFSKIGALFNVFHLVVLTRKTMMTSSINTIMIGIAVCDLFSMLIVIRNGWIQRDLNPFGTDCSPPPSLLRMRLDWLLSTAHNGLRRCSAWLGMLIALVRFLVIADVSVKSNKFSSPKFGLRMLLLAFVISSVFSFLFYLHFDFVLIATWQPKSTCVEEDEKGAWPVYTQQCNPIFEMHDGLFSRIRLVFEGLVGKMIPCILLPILTALLILEMRKSERSPQTVQQSFRKARRDRTTILVIFIAISFLISELPIGIIDIFEAVWHDDPRFMRITQNVVFLCDSIFTANASIHCFICFAMSFHYRKTVWNLLKSAFRCKSNRIVNTTRVASVLSSGNK